MPRISKGSPVDSGLPPIEELARCVGLLNLPEGYYDSGLSKGSPIPRAVKDGDLLKGLKSELNYLAGDC